MATGPIDAWLKNPRGPLVPAIRPKPVAMCTEKQTVIAKKFSTKPATVRSRKRRAAAAKKKLAKTPTNVIALETGDSDSDSGDAQQKKKPKNRTHLAMEEILCRHGAQVGIFCWTIRRAEGRELHLFALKNNYKVPGLDTAC